MFGIWIDLGKMLGMWLDNLTKYSWTSWYRHTKLLLNIHTYVPTIPIPHIKISQKVGLMKISSDYIYKTNKNWTNKWIPLNAHSICIMNIEINEWMNAIVNCRPFCLFSTLSPISFLFSSVSPLLTYNSPWRRGGGGGDKELYTTLNYRVA